MAWPEIDAIASPGGRLFCENSFPNHREQLSHDIRAMRPDVASFAPLQLLRCTRRRVEFFNTFSSHLFVIAGSDYNNWTRRDSRHPLTGVERSSMGHSQKHARCHVSNRRVVNAGLETIREPITIVQCAVNQPYAFESIILCSATATKGTPKLTPMSSTREGSTQGCAINQSSAKDTAGGVSSNPC
jgi:hypothetical protein